MNIRKLNKGEKLPMELLLLADPSKILLRNMSIGANVL